MLCTLVVVQFSMTNHLAASSKRLDYYTTTPRLCQEVFSTFFKSFSPLVRSVVSAALATACIVYHIPARLSRGYFHFSHFCFKYAMRGKNSNFFCPCRTYLSKQLIRIAQPCPMQSPSAYRYPTPAPHSQCQHRQWHWRPSPLHAAASPASPQNER